ncbi:MAG: hypothetical protein HUU35_07965 [Armatimonadetes bacterium]|nr:hypothetical protein [Armatimonadota bacterium]
MSGWMILWSLVWFVGLGLFAWLSVAVTIHGWRDLRGLVRTLEQRHAAAAGEPPAEG